MTVPVFKDGFEDGKYLEENYTLSGSPVPILSYAGSPPNGQRCMECTTPAAAGAPRAQRDIPSSSIVALGFRWQAATNNAHGILQFQSGPRFDWNTGNKIQSPTGFNSAVLTLSQWYWLSILIDYATSPGNLLLSWSIDGVAQQTATSAVDATGAITQIKFGMIEAQASKTQRFDDIVVHVGDTTDYPVADQVVGDWKSITRVCFPAFPKPKLVRA